jgi:2-dehydropantoate 2-reductase
LVHAQSKWHLLGAGSMGCLFAAYLQRAGIVFELIVRNEESLRQLHANGGITLLRDNERTTIPVAATTSNDLQTPITQLLICTKAQQTLAAVATIKTRVASGALIVLLQNGMGVRELLQQELPHAIIFNALSTEGAFRNMCFHVAHAGRGDTVIGTVAPQQHILAEKVVQALRCELAIAFAADIERRMWLKLAVSSVINPLTAIHRCRNGELLKLDSIDATVRQLCDELEHVARAEAIQLSALQMRNEVFQVLRATANNKSSMLQDIAAGRVTEIDFINGFIVQRAHRHRIACPQHTALLDEVRALES